MPEDGGLKEEDRPAEPSEVGEEPALQKRLMALKAEKAAGSRPPGKSHGRWLGDFLDHESETGLLPTEEKLLAASVRGEWCWLSSDTENIRASFLRFLALGGDEDAPVHELGLLLEGAVITGEFNLMAARNVLPLLLYDCQFTDQPNFFSAHLASLSLQGSQVPGLLANEAEITGSVFLSNGFTAEGEVRFLGARIGGVLSCEDGTFHNRTKDSQGTALHCGRAKITGDVFLTKDFTAEGEVRFLGARIGGVLSCEDGTFHNRTKDGQGIALNCGRAKITGDVFLTKDFTAEGEVRFLGARIGGVLSCEDGTFHNRTKDGQGIALNCDTAKIAGSVFLSNGFTAAGEVRFLGATIGGDLALSKGTFNNACEAPPDIQKRDRRPLAAKALNLGKVQIYGTLWMGPATAPYDQCPEIQGSVALAGAYARQLVDHPDAWPGANGSACVTAENGQCLLCTIGLNGFTYDRLMGKGQYDVKTRKDWLKRQPREHLWEDFRPQPYEQLTKVLRAMGHDRRAREIAKSRQWQQRLARWRRAWPGWRTLMRHPWRVLRFPRASIVHILEMILFGLIAGYGYGNKRFMIMLTALWLAGAFFYTQASEQGLMAPTNPVVYANTTIAQACARNWTTCTALPKEHTAFDPFLYSADVMLPIIAFGVERDWDPIYAKTAAPGLPNGSVMKLQIWGWVLKIPHWGLRCFYWVQIVIGWSLSVLFVAVLTGVMKND